MMTTRISYPDGPRVPSPGSPELKTAKELPLRLEMAGKAIHGKFVVCMVGHPRRLS